MKRIRYKDDSVEVIDSSVFAKYLDNIIELAVKSGVSNKHKAFAFSYPDYMNDRSTEKISFLYRYDYSKSNTVRVKITLECQKAAKKIKYTVRPDFFSSAADQYAGTTEIESDNLKEFLGSLHWRIREDLVRYFKLFNNYLLVKQNRDNEFAIDSLEYLERLKSKFEPKGLIVKMVEDDGDCEGYEITVTDKKDEDNYVSFGTVPYRITDYGGSFSDFVDHLEMDLDGEFANISDLYKGIEKFVDGMLEYKEVMTKYSKILSKLCPDLSDEDD
jgi:hypothetical protein